MRGGTKFIVANWKMNFSVFESSLLVAKLSELLPRNPKNSKTNPGSSRNSKNNSRANLSSDPPNPLFNSREISPPIKIILCPGFLALQTLATHLDRHVFSLGAQNCYWRDSGAFTGEVSAQQLRGLAEFVICGHSERRQIFREDETTVRFKVQAVLRNRMSPILCVGETFDQRERGDTVHILQNQVASGLQNVRESEISRVVLAYEPVWAIGSRHIPTPRDISEATKIIRETVARLFGEIPAAKIPVLYGGSVNPTDLRGILSVSDLDGILVGGDSLIAEDFAKIIQLTRKIYTERSTVSALALSPNSAKIPTSGPNSTHDLTENDSSASRDTASAPAKSPPDDFANQTLASDPPTSSDPSSHFREIFTDSLTKTEEVS